LLLDTFESQQSSELDIRCTIDTWLNNAFLLNRDNSAVSVLTIAYLPLAISNF
jgi:hypothetical protein